MAPPRQCAGSGLLRTNRRSSRPLQKWRTRIAPQKPAGTWYYLEPSLSLNASLFTPPRRCWVVRPTPGLYDPSYESGVTPPDYRRPSATAVKSPLMPPRKGLRTNPAAYVIDGGTWPRSRLVDDAPPEAAVLRIISKEVRAAVEARGSEAKFAQRAGISRRTVRNILRGETWMDLPTLYRIEECLDKSLWLRSNWPSHGR